MSKFWETVKATWEKIPARYKNVYFWTGLIGVVAVAVDADLQTFTSWAALGSFVRDLVSNPAMLVAGIMAAIGVFVDPTTKGLKDK